MIAARQLAFGKAAGAAKPYKARLEYLESSGTQYIDTGINMRNYLAFDTEYMTLGKSLSSGAPFCCVYGAYNPQNIGVASIASIQYYSAANIGNRYMDKNTLITELNFKKRTIEHRDNNSFYLIYDGVRHNLNAFGSTQIAESPVSIWLFGIYYINDSRRTTPLRMYYFQVRDNDDLILDLIPVLDNDLVPCMYDKVSGEFFYNAGTGEFIAGPEI